ncbi:flagellar biosynthetic protein FliO [Aquabacterium sp. A7-Y]|uniref:FliO/MopB family protein n=1 Tax=Aquabacterium sp. A7-Y TaxID=1349605 RepID=UPI00223E8CCF|nr:flagellar biosynthetic protein FliO [Aquabacterium sp. A7-Y]MCW7540562.1 flagellar biosynthetic protein FliO [Aquabacterium sp. A7-Y]
MPSAGTSALWFLLIIAMIPAALWLLKRSQAAGLGGLGHQQLTRVLSITGLGPQQRVVTVEVGQGDERRWLVLGVTAQSITTLHTMAAQELPPPAALQMPKLPPSFAALLNKARGDK